MKCESVRDWFSLYLYGELDAASEDALVEHLAVCESCRQGLEREKRMHRALDTVQVKPAPELLERCRSELPVTIRQAGVWTGWRRRIASVVGMSSVPTPWLRLAGAVALVAIGFFSARLAPDESRTQVGCFGAVGDRGAPCPE